MTTLRNGGRFAAALVAICLLVSAGAGPVGATFVNPVTPSPGGGASSHNVQGLSGNATGASITPNSDGTSNAWMSYSTPSDGSNYDGTQSVVVTDANGNLVGNYTLSFTDPATGQTMYDGMDGIYIPTGGSISISVSASNWSGGRFSARWNLRNYQPSEI